MPYIPPTHKFVAVLNKKIPAGNLMNALAHATAGLVASYPQLEDMRFDNYQDADRNDHAAISDNPYIILRAKNGNQLRELRRAAIAEKVHCTDFINTMTVGTYADQQARTKQTPEAELEYYAICLFGEIATLTRLTKKFSLWHE